MDPATTASFLRDISDFRGSTKNLHNQSNIFDAVAAALTLFSPLFCGGVTDRKGQNLRAENGANKNAATSIHP